jgi:hypothetical protein
MVCSFSVFGMLVVYLSGRLGLSREIGQSYGVRLDLKSYLTQRLSLDLPLFIASAGRYDADNEDEIRSPLTKT